MTVLITEIHVPHDLRKATIVFAADSKVTKAENGKHSAQGCKIFRIPYLKAGIGFFGLASFNNMQMASYLTNFINRNTGAGSLKEWAHLLKDNLNKAIGSQTLAKYGIGLHLCGFNAEGLPEFWFLTNIPGMTGHLYAKPSNHISVREDFLSSDSKKILLEGSQTIVKEPVWQVYRNGDTRVHALAFEKLDEIIKSLLSFEDFKNPKTVDDYLEIVKLKMDIMCKIYSKLANCSLIGTPINAFAIDCKGRFYPENK